MNQPTDINSWLEGLGLGDLAAVFEANDVTHDILHTLTADDIREMGITSLGHRKKLLAAITALNAHESPATHYSPPPPEPPREVAVQPPDQPARQPFVAPRGQAKARPRSAPPVQPQTQPEVLPKVAPRRDPPGTLPQLVPLPLAPPRPAATPVQEIAEPPEILPSDEPPVVATGKKKRKAFSSGFLAVSIGVHVLLGLGAGYLIVQRIEAKRKLQFSSLPPTANPSKRALEHKVSLQKKKNAGGAPAQARRIAVAGLAAQITLPDMPSVPTSNQFVAGRMAGMGGAGFGTGLGFGNGNGMGVGGMGKGGLGLTMFGSRNGGGLAGTFYDLKRDKHGRSNGMKSDHALYTKILKDFTSGWKMPPSQNCYTGSSRLMAKAFMFPTIQDTEAGKAFSEPETGPGMWIAHYSGSVTPSVSGKYRFVGWADNVLFVGIGSKLVLDASDVNYLGAGGYRNNRGSNIPIPGKEATPLPQIAGAWFDLTAGRSVKMDVVLGDEGGVFCGGLLLEKEGESVGTGKYNIPDLPMFLAGPLGMEEKRLYDKLVSDKAMNGPVFKTSNSGSSPMDAIRR